MRLSLLLFFASLGVLVFAPVSAADFDPNTLFPAWGHGGQIQGVIGSNNGSLESGSSKLALHFVPRIINFLMIIVAPIVMVMFGIAGLHYIWSDGREEETQKARGFFVSGMLGLIFIVASYSFMKAIYFIIA